MARTEPEPGKQKNSPTASPQGQQMPSNKQKEICWKRGNSIERASFYCEDTQKGQNLRIEQEH